MGRRKENCASPDFKNRINWGKNVIQKTTGRGELASKRLETPRSNREDPRYKDEVIQKSTPFKRSLDKIGNGRKGGNSTEKVKPTFVPGRN